MNTKKTILIAEDSAPNRNILVQLLKSFGFDVLEAKTGSEAWTQIIERESNSQPLHAIITDIMMPSMSGIELLQKIRAENKLPDVPIIFITAVAEKEHILKAKELQAQGYLLKPISKDKLLKKCQEIFPDHAFPSFPGAA